MTIKRKLSSLPLNEIEAQEKSLQIWKLVNFRLKNIQLQGVVKKKKPPSKMAYLVYNDYK